MRERQPALCLGSFVTKRQKTGSAREETKGRTSLLPAFKAYPVRFELSEGGGQRGHARGDEGKDGLTQLISVALPFSFALATNRSILFPSECGTALCVWGRGAGRVLSFPAQRPAVALPGSSLRG